MKKFKVIEYKCVVYEIEKEVHLSDEFNDDSGKWTTSQWDEFYKINCSAPEKEIDYWTDSREVDSIELI